MEFIVTKIGTTMFDTLHAYGLAILLAYATRSDVHLTNEEVCFHLRCKDISQRFDLEDGIKDLLGLPSVDVLRQYKPHSDLACLPVQILDGLLAVLFTYRGLRAVSVHDVFAKERVDSTALEEALAKVHGAIRSKLSIVAKETCNLPDGFTALLQDYDVAQSLIPIPINGSSKSFNIVSTIDPAFTHSTRRSSSDGRVSDKTNITFVGTPFAPILTFIGAAYFLHAQRVDKAFVLFYLPIAEILTVSVDMMLPLFNYSPLPLEQTLARQWIEQPWRRLNSSSQWSGLTYHVMQTQGAQQSLSRYRGILDFAKLDAIERQVGASVNTRWSAILQVEQSDSPIELNNLIDALLHRQLEAWVAHLMDAAQQLLRPRSALIKPYHISEVVEVTKIMFDSKASPLRGVLEREQGTRRFGYALRQLGRHNQAILRDLADELGSVHDCAQLLQILHRVIQECLLAAAKSPFFRIPDDTDLAYLLDDIDRYGAHTVSTLLIILSVLRYPRFDNSADDSVSDTLGDLPISEELSNPAS